MRKTYQQLLDDNHRLQMSVEDLLDVILNTGRYHHRLEYRPDNAPRNEANPPGAKGLDAAVRRAKDHLSKSRGSRRA